MATPMSTTSQDESANKKLEQITFRFCSECSNMLYPKEDEETHRLQFTCRTCQFTEEAQSTCVFRNVMNNAAGETAGVTQDVGSDPTVGDSQCVLAPVVCIGCGHAILCTGCGNPSDDFNVSAVVVQPADSQSKKAEITFHDQTRNAPSARAARLFSSSLSSEVPRRKLFYVCCDCGHIFQ
ncbi:DNA-directed RNA polymerase subunit [Colletotrichum higginsianum IMI 349063]|uniref:DNA-directed RNA polymerase subunit n=1 Tax=Colletotrichum higginsianum (strain IMI 349063) TaxID=759273 RepID=A0A1B7YSA0_COLHI|nr:DNA-directed RNA polymerase subunit [Colletotrichum higginsianum IMI 349063]OBR14768.1 DNA-directed RNA polymerase subunit [Colletotrichum higginsianum IMI 349063]